VSALGRGEPEKVRDVFNGSWKLDDIDEVKI
jgi:hypothetical protein